MSNHDNGHEASTHVALRDTTGPDRFENPGHPEHHARLGDLDPKANKKAERQVVFLFTISILGTLAFIVAYFAFPPGETPETMRRSNITLGLSMAFGGGAHSGAAGQRARRPSAPRRREDEPDDPPA